MGVTEFKENRKQEHSCNFTQRNLKPERSQPPGLSLFGHVLVGTPETLVGVEPGAYPMSLAAYLGLIPVPIGGPSTLSLLLGHLGFLRPSM